MLQDYSYFRQPLPAAMRQRTSEAIPPPKSSRVPMTTVLNITKDGIQNR
jgi:hypothetical protein